MAIFRNKSAFFLIASAALAGPAANGQVGLGLSPMRLEFAVAPGAVHSGSLYLSNESRAVIRVRAELLDFFIDDQQTPQFAPRYASERESSCRNWLVANPMEVEVPPAASTPVRYTFRVPADAGTRSFHCAIGFTTLPAADQMAGMGLRTSVRMVAAFYAVVGEPPIEGEVTKITLEPRGAGGDWQATVRFRNWGFRHFRPLGEISLLDENGAVIETTPFPPLPVLPQREQPFHFPLRAALTQRKYTLRVRVDIGAAEVQETSVDVTPPSRGK